MEINTEQQEMLKQLCDSCKRTKRCKNHNKLCFAKTMTFRIARMVYKKRFKKGLIKDDSC